ncbi:MAG TPA: choice-of-anchor B family protein [Ardenticatenaceae bacterium]|jgi:choice-of-anchor B domain-containing protein
MNRLSARHVKLSCLALMAALSGYLLLALVAPLPARSQSASTLRFPTPTPPGTDGGQAEAIPAPYCEVKAEARQPIIPLPFMSNLTCENGRAGEFPCNNVDLLSFLPLDQMGGGEGNDIWGWTDPQTGREYALMGRSRGIAFVDITVPQEPVYVGDLPTHTFENLWRSVKVYQDHAYVVADYAGAHGVQVFDLTELRDVTNPPVTFTESAHYDGFGSAHNIVINEESGFAYAVGISSGGEMCNKGLHMIDIREPTRPTFAGCFGNDGYTHDAQCVVYNGPDAEHRGQEICFNANLDSLTIVDVSDKQAPRMLSRTVYEGVAYTHQGWLTEDQRHFLLDDEFDEPDNNHPTRTYIWDLSDLDEPRVSGHYDHPTRSRDHNLYIHEGFAYEANFRSGLRVLDIAEVADARLTEVGYFDVDPTSDAVAYGGAWGVYPFFESGSVVVSDMERGLFVLRANLPVEASPTPTGTSSPTVTITQTPPPTGTVTGTISPSTTSTATPTRTSTPIGPSGERLLYLPILHRR